MEDRVEETYNRRRADVGVGGGFGAKGEKHVSVYERPA